MASLFQDSALNSYDLLLIQEPWRNPVNHAAYNPSNSSFWSVELIDRNSRVCTYVNKRFPQQDWSEIVRSQDLISILLKVKNDTAEREILIHNVYRPPNQTDDRTVPNTLSALQSAVRGKDEQIVAGDLNLHHPLWTEESYGHRHSEAETLIEIMSEAELTLLTPKGTITRDCQRGTRTERTTIDLIFATERLAANLTRCDTDYSLEHGSDHLPIGTTFQTDEQEQQALVRRRAWKKLDLGIFLNTFDSLTHQISQRENLQSYEINDYAQLLTKATQTAIEKATPWARNSPYNKSWWTEECAEAVKLTRRLRRAFTKHPCQTTWQTFVQQRDQKGKIIAKAKRDDFRKTMYTATGNPQSLWKIVRWAKGHAQGIPPTQELIPTLRSNDHQATSCEEKAQIFKNECFPPPPTVDLSDLNTVRYPHSLKTAQEISNDEIRKAALQMKKDKAPGPDEIPNRVIHLIVRERVNIVQTLYQACLTYGIHPESFRTAITVMLKKPKKPDYSNPGAYRPIALLNTLGKVLESVITNRLKILAEKFNLLPDTQYGARAERSTDLALSNLTSQIRTIQKSGGKKTATLLSLDVSKAFDRVSHPRLIHNLRKRQIPILLTNWISSFLSNRRTMIRIGNYTSQEMKISVGIPQGSPISPILYLFYNADLLDACSDLSLRTEATGFVDDVNILAYGGSATSNCRAIEIIHKRCEKWARKHGSKFCPEKYELIHFTRTNKRPQAAIRLGETNLQPKENIRVLGVHLDRKLRFRAHLRTLEEKTISAVKALRTITGSTWGSSLHRGRDIYQTVVRPALSYGANTWAPISDTKEHRKGMSNLLQSLQGKCLRVIAGAYRSTSTEALEIETFVRPLDLHVEESALKTALQMRSAPAAKGIQDRCQRIRTIIRNKRRRKEQHVEPITSTAERKLQMIADKQPTKSARTKITKLYKRTWARRWAAGTKGHHTRALTPHPTVKTLSLHNGRTKPISALITQLRTGKIGFNEFLFKQRVPGVPNPTCICGISTMSVQHVLLECGKWQVERSETIDKLDKTNLQTILNTRRGCHLATQFVLRTKLLSQFSEQTRSREEVEEVEEEEKEEER